MPGNDRHHDDKVHPFVKPGESLGYVVALKQRDNWPPKWQGYTARDREHTATPYLVVPATPGDIGIRPLPTNEALFNNGIEIVDNGGNVVSEPVPGNTYQLRCWANNLGAKDACGGMAEFYIGEAMKFDALAASPGSTMPIFGFTGFTAQPGVIRITCPKLWTPADAKEATSSIVVAVYDPFIDRVISPFNAISDRHIGRRDFIPDFSGIWNGIEIFDRTVAIAPGFLQDVNIAHIGVIEPALTVTQDIPPSSIPSPGIRHTLPDTLSIAQAVSLTGISIPPLLEQDQFLIRMVITQSGLTVNASIYSQVGGVLPTTPQNIGSGTFSGGQVQINTIASISGIPLTSDNYTLSRHNATTLHFEHHIHFLRPGDPRPDMHLHGDLTRM